MRTDLRAAASVAGARLSGSALFPVPVRSEPARGASRWRLKSPPHGRQGNTGTVLLVVHLRSPRSMDRPLSAMAVWRLSEQLADEIDVVVERAYSRRLALSTNGTTPPVSWSTALPE